MIYRYLILIILASNLSGCAWIALDRYYELNDQAEAWESTFREGKTSSKVMGYPDTYIHSFKQPEFELKVQISYQDIAAVGPVIVPIIPTPWKSHKRLIIKSLINTNTKIELDLSSWVVFVNDEVKHAHEIVVCGECNPVEGVLEIVNDNNIYHLYDVKFADIDEMTLEFGDFFLNNHLITIPPLQLQKAKGAWRYEAWTV